MAKNMKKFLKMLSGCLLATLSCQSFASDVYIPPTEKSIQKYIDLKFSKSDFETFRQDLTNSANGMQLKFEAQSDKHPCEGAFRKVLWMVTEDGAAMSYLTARSLLREFILAEKMGELDLIYYIAQKTRENKYTSKASNNKRVPPSASLVKKYLLLTENSRIVDIFLDMVPDARNNVKSREMYREMFELREFERVQNTFDAPSIKNEILFYQTDTGKLQLKSHSKVAKSFAKMFKKMNDQILLQLQSVNVEDLCANEGTK